MEKVENLQKNIDNFTFYFNMNNEEEFMKLTFQKLKEMDLSSRKKITTVIIDASERVLFAEVFSYLPKLQTVILPDTAENKFVIEPNAFLKNKKLTKIIINEFMNLIATEESFAGVNSKLKIVAGDINPKRVTKPKMLNVKLFLQLYYSNADNIDEKEMLDVSTFKYMSESKLVQDQKMKCYKSLQKKFELLSRADSLISKRYWNKVEEKATKKLMVRILRSAFVWSLGLLAIAIGILFLINFDFQQNLVYVVGGFGITLFMCILLKGFVRTKNKGNRYTKRVEKFENKFYKNLEKLDNYYNE